jgi:hypothetical protein
VEGAVDFPAAAEVAAVFLVLEAAGEVARVSVVAVEVAVQAVVLVVVEDHTLRLPIPQVVVSAVAEEHLDLRNLQRLILRLRWDLPVEEEMGK